MSGRSTVGSAKRGSKRVLTISKDRDVFTGMVLIEVSLDKLRRALDVVMHHAEETIKRMPGFVGYAFLESLDGKRVTEYVQWESTDHIQAAFKDPRFSAHLTDVRKFADEEFFPYETYYVNEVGHQVGEGKATISKEVDSLTAITEFAVRPGKQQALLDLIVDDHDPVHCRRYPGSPVAGRRWVVSTVASVSTSPTTRRASPPQRRARNEAATMRAGKVCKPKSGENK